MLWKKVFCRIIFLQNIFGLSGGMCLSRERLKLLTGIKKKLLPKPQTRSHLHVIFVLLFDVSQISPHIHMYWVPSLRGEVVISY